VDSNALKAASPVAQDSAEMPAVKRSASSGGKPVQKPAAKSAHVNAQSENAFAVPAKKSAPKAKSHAAAPKHHPVVTTHPAGTAQHHPTQVAHP
jgi:hypothetical protein